MIALRTERLVIIALPSDDGAPNLTSKNEVKNFLKLQMPSESSASGNKIPTTQQLLQATHGIQWICLNEQELQQVGTVTSYGTGQADLCYMGYFILPAHRRKGYATEAVPAVTEWLLANSGAAAIISETYSDWTVSIKVMEKAGLSRVNTNLGSDIVRYALVKDASEVDVTEGPVVTLLPFQYRPRHHLAGLARWQWSRRQELIPLIFCILLLFKITDGTVAIIILIFFCAYSSYLLRRITGWYQLGEPETLIQLRKAGLFYANRAGFGGITPWATFSSFRLPKRGGLEIWNSQTWYWIPPQAFTESSLPQAQLFLTEHGVSAYKARRRFTE